MLSLGSAAFAVNRSSADSAFNAALYETQVGADAARAYFLVNLMRRAEAPAADVDALGRELLHGYLNQIAAAAATPAPVAEPGVWDAWMRRLRGQGKVPRDDVAAALARGRQRDNVLDAPFRSAWQGALNKALALRWESGTGRAPVFTMAMRDMQPIAPGIWAAPSADGQVRLMLSLRVANTAAVPLPLWRPDIVLQGELRFTCNWDRPARTESEMQANTVTLLQPGAESDPLACEAAPVAGHWREQLIALTAASGKPGLQTELVPHDLDSKLRYYYLELALAHAAPQTVAWSERLLLARHEPHRQWRPAQRALDPPESGRYATAPHRGWAATGAALASYLAATVLALGLFAGGRLMRRAGVPQGGVAVITVLAVGGLWALATAQLGGGTGYSHPFYVGLALWAAYLGPLLFAVVALHGLHKLLDEEQLAWWQTVANGWRHTLNLRAETSRAEFWGFVAHCAWLWVLARLCFVPLDRWVGLFLLVPLSTLTFRRMRSMTGREWLTLGIGVLCVVLLILL